MPIVTRQADSKFKIVLDGGLDENNKKVTKSKTFSKVRSTVPDEDLYELGLSLSELQSYPLTNIVKYEEYEIINEE